MTKPAVRAPRCRVAVAAVTLACGLASHHANAAGTATTPPSPPTTVPPLIVEDGIFKAPDGSFAVGFTSVPSRVIDTENEIVSFLLGVEEDTQSVVIFRPSALGATPDATPSDRADLFLTASGTNIEPLVNTTTQLGPFGAAHFIAELTLSDGRRAVVYGLVVAREKDVVYVFYTDVGRDDNEAGSDFVESFALMIDPPPTPTTSTTTTTTTATDPIAAVGEPAATEASTEAPTATSTTAATTSPTTIQQPAPPATVVAPAGATVGYDGRWWVTFPDGAAPAFRASSANGFAYSEYLAVDGDDTMIVTVTHVPTGYEWEATAVPDAVAARIGGGVEDSEVINVQGHEAVRFTLADDDSETSGDTVEMLVVNGGDRIYEIRFEDGGTTSTERADDFIESFELA